MGPAKEAVMAVMAVMAGLARQVVDQAAGSARSLEADVPQQAKATLQVRCALLAPARLVALADSVERTFAQLLGQQGQHWEATLRA